MDSQKWLDYAPVKPWPRSLGYLLEGTKLARWEAQLSRQFDLCTVATRREAESAAGLGITTPVAVFPNGVDRIVQRFDEGRLVDNRPAGSVDQEGPFFHLPQFFTVQKTARFL